MSPISLGTVELGGEPYGLYYPREKMSMSRQRAIRLLLEAFERGITLVDTAPAYGDSEVRIGEALDQSNDPVHVATKVDATPRPGEPFTDTRRRMEASIERSRRRLGRDELDLVQIHNASASVMRHGGAMEVLDEAREKGHLRWIGATVYEPEVARIAIEDSRIAAIQIAYNLLDQRMAGSVFEEAVARDVAVWVRSAFLKGVLTPRWKELPAGAEALRRAVERVENWSMSTGRSLPRAALRFCLSNEHVASVLVGVRTLDELEEAIETSLGPPLSSAEFEIACSLAIDDPDVVDPRSWDVP